MYDWDDNNEEHIARHGVERWEAEDALEDADLVPFSARGGRAGILGMTEDGRLLAVIFERRSGAIRVVTARDTTSNEKGTYRRRNK